MSRGFDATDRAILDILQADAERPVAAIAEAVGLSPTPCWRRIRRMEQAGLIRGRVVVVDPVLANVGLTIFIGIKAPRHEIAWLEKFRQVIAGIDEIVEAYRMTGQTDYILKMVVPDVKTYDTIYKHMIGQIDFLDVVSSLSMEELKYSRSIPTTYL